MKKKQKKSHAAKTPPVHTPPLQSPSSMSLERISCSEKGPKKSKLKITARIGNIFKVKKDKKKRESKQHKTTQPKKLSSKEKIKVAAQPVVSKKDVSEKTCKSYRITKEPKKTASRSPVKSKPCTSPGNNSVQKEQPDKSCEYKPPPVSVEKIEKSVQNLLDKIQPKCSRMLEDQWVYIDDISFKDEECAAFLEHDEEYNQAEEVECLDVNRVKLEKTETRTHDYIHASYVEIKDIPRKFVLAQFPTTNSKRLEDFWTMIYQEKLHNIYMLCSPEESTKPNDKFSEYFPTNNGHHEHYGQIWVHNRKVEMATDATDTNDTYIIEVLPSGCAESILVTLQMLNYWPVEDVGLKAKKVLASASNVFGVADAYEGDPIGIISKRGAGRTGTYLAIVCAIQLMKNGQNIDMKEFCRSIRRQRPGGIDNYFQFVFIYQMILQFASQHVTNKDLKATIGRISKKIEYILSMKNSNNEEASAN